MKIGFLGLSIILILIACKGENSVSEAELAAIDSLRQNDWEKANLKAKVKSKEIFVYTATANEGEAGKGVLKNIQLTTYDEQGNELEINLYNDKKEILYSWKNIYDNNGNCVEKNYNDGHISRKLTFVFDDKKLCKEAAEYVDGQLMKKTTYLYNELGQEIEAYEKFEGQTVQNKLASKYDEKDKLRETIAYDEKGGVALKQLFTYNDLGYLNQHSVFGGDNAPIYKRLYQYDEFGHKIQDFGFGANSELSLNDCFKYAYQYDNKENWVLRKTSDYHDKILEIAEQKIIYYE